MEAWVRAQLLAGHVADLDERVSGGPGYERESERIRRAASFEELALVDQVNSDRLLLAALRERSATVDNDNKRLLSAAFLEDLATMSPSMDRRGVHILHAVVLDRLDLEDADVSHEVRLEQSRFDEGVNLSKGTFREQLSFAGSLLARSDFSNMQVVGDATFDNSVFTGPVDFSGARIGGSLGAVGAQFKGADFDTLKVGDHADFSRATFTGTVTFSSADIGRNLVADNARFQGHDTDKIPFAADFNLMKVGGHAFLRDAVFDGSVRFTAATVAGSLEMNRSRFQRAEFDTVKIGSHALLDGAVFKGPLTFVDSFVGGDFFAVSAKFDEPALGASFNSLKVGHTAIFRDAIFAGPVDFVASDIGFNLEAERAKFNNPTAVANFGSMTVRGNVFLDGAAFRGPVNFTEARVTNDFEVSDVKFLNQESTGGANFSGMSIGSSAFLIRTNFAGPVDLTSADIGGDLNATDTTFPSASVTRFTNTKVAKTIIFDGAKFPLSYNLSDVTYQRVDRRTDAATPEGPLGLIQRAQFSPSAYANLEAFYAREGEKDLADQVFIERRRHDRRQLFILARPLDWLLDLSVGYGRHPERAFIASAGFILIGWLLVFWDLGTAPPRLNWLHYFLDRARSYLPKESYPGKVVWFVVDHVLARAKAFARRRPPMVPQKDGYALDARIGGSPHQIDGPIRPYDPFWYSLDLFVPVLDLGERSDWIPADGGRLGWRWLYMRVHTAAGWLLIPIGLAAVTGLIK